MKFIRKHLTIIITLIIIIVTISVIGLKFMLVKASSIEEENTEKEIEKQEEALPQEKVEESNIKYLKVDIKGEIKKPGVYTLEEKSRVVDVINLAGGLTKNADTSTINLAKIITDEMVIVVCSKEEIEKIKQSANEKGKEECICPSIENDADIQNNEEQPQEQDKISGKVNLNTATIEQLQEIPGLGEKKSQAIIKYRTEHGFTKIEDLLNVDGIGNTIYEKIKDYFTLS